MAEELPDYLKMKLMKKIMSKAMKSSEEKKKAGKEKTDPEKIVWEKLRDERARELMYKAKTLYPDRYPLVIQVLHTLIHQGKIKELDGYTTLLLLHRLGVPVKPDLKIRFVKHGKEVDMKEYLE
ncbi:hypothetical protein [Staphylothermus hellenicus]|uniref:DNA-binding protein n=1 Tax=Staphylothermus hellenicus (strain DSM 12710 / JCM 10830 / BK20S6-10-b1 / P8) TaxID=591019 RepID=D7DBW5_STAHD|nr:hypothetical protein [Staphylothermus hellenicus]ADI31662.1 hypothetical protein Shell_0531 [Staphylothermus hellenicus DSM 12710]